MTRAQIEKISPRDIVSGIPADGWSGCDGDPGLHAFEVAKGQVASWEQLTLVGLKRYLALHRHDPWFLRPAWGNSEADFLATECQLLLWQRCDGLWAVMVPTAHGNRRAWLQGEKGGLSFLTRGACRQEEPEELCLLILGIGKDPTELVQRAVKAGIKRLRTAKPRIEKVVPPWVDLLGWCTWDAFYKEVTAAKVEEGLQAFAKDKISVPLLIIDDGWQQSKDVQLLSFEADPVKFPGGLLEFTERVKAQYGVAMVGVWHALVGYWNGVHAEGELGERYRLCPSFHGAYNIPASKLLHRSMVHPDDIHRFYHDLHGYLRSQGVDMVKVDNQASLDHFTENIVPDYLSVTAYQEAVQGAASFHFGNNLLHCMAMSADIAWHLASSAVWRNSQDYLPKKPENHGIHLVSNAANALWSSGFALPDWDMFHSGGAAGWFHGAARAISGGPVYISDTPGNHDAELLRALTLSGGRIPRPPAPARVADSRILIDCTSEDRLLLVRNKTAAGFLLGIFHCRHSNISISDSWAPLDAGAQGAVIVRDFRSGQCRRMDAADFQQIELLPLGWNIFTIVPLVHGIAPIGLDGKLAGAAAITRWDNVTETVSRAELLDGGQLRIWCDKPLVAFDREGGSLPVHHDSDLIWIIQVPTGRESILTIVR